LQQLEGQITRILQNQDVFTKDVLDLKDQVQDLDRRVIKLELR
jgi:polyhydroxyalkanoate synthesis regulator phasin